MSFHHPDGDDLEDAIAGYTEGEDVSDDFERNAFAKASSSVSHESSKEVERGTKCLLRASGPAGTSGR